MDETMAGNKKKRNRKSIKNPSIINSKSEIMRIYTVKDIIDRKRSEYQNIATQLTSANLHHEESKFLRAKICMLESFLTEQLALHELLTDKFARQVYSYIEATAILERYNGQLPDPVIYAKVKEASSKEPTEADLKPIKDFLKRPTDINAGPENFQKFFYELVHLKASNLL